jgi:hypothetical protein
MGQQQVEAESLRGRCGALIIAAGALLCLVILAVVEQKPCKKPETEKLGNSPVWDYCGTEREREAANE